jgi:hypothetical protein
LLAEHSIYSILVFPSDIINSGGPRMAIPGTVMFCLLGLTGQLVVNFVKNWRIRYIYDHEQEWKAAKERAVPTTKSNSTEWEGRFEFIGKYAGLKKSDPGKRIAVIRKEIEELDGQILKVDVEIAKLEREKQEGRENQ